MKPPFLSIIIPIYNGSHFLEETIKSVLVQPHKDFELILLDDGSKDNSFEISKKYESEQVRVLSHSNMGVSKTRNKGIELSRGRVIIFMDQDDSMRSDFYTEHIKSRLDFMLKQGVELFVAGTWWGDELLEKGFFRSVEVLKKGIYKGRNDSISWGNTYTFNMNLFSRNLFFNKNNIPTEVRFLDLPLDVETTFRHISQYSANKILFSDDFSFCIRRNNSSSVSSNWNWLKVHSVRCDAYYKLIDWHKQNFPNDKDAIYGAEKAFIKTVEEFLSVTYKTNKNIKFAITELQNKNYFDDLLVLINTYPQKNRMLEILIKNPEMGKKFFHVCWLRRVFRLRWKIYEKMCKRKNIIYLRKNILNI